MSIKSPDIKGESEKSEDLSPLLSDKERLARNTRFLVVLATGLALAGGFRQAENCSEEEKPLIEQKEVKKSPEKHKRVEDDKYGVINMWHPEHEGTLNEVVVFVHGHRTANSPISSDLAWKRYHNLQEQFKESGRKALFIASDSPINDAGNARDMYRWERTSPKRKSVRELIAIAKGDLKIENMDPHAPITVIAHSGGYSTAAAWSEVKDVKNIILLDALYGHFEHFHRFVRGGGNLSLVSTKRRRGSLRRSRRFMRRYKKMRGVKYIESPYSHGSLPRKYIKGLLQSGSKKNLRLKRRGK